MNNVSKSGKNKRTRDVHCQGQGHASQLMHHARISVEQMSSNILPAFLLRDGALLHARSACGELALVGRYVKVVHL